MKKNLYIYILAASITAFTGCKKDFLETIPTDQIDQNVAFESISNAKLALNGMYRIVYSQVASNQNQDGHGAMMINIDGMGEDLVWTGVTSAYMKYAMQWNTHILETSSLSSFPYILYYRLTSNANMIIENIDNIEGETAEKNTIKAEAYAMRAFCYMNLVQIYGKRYDATKQNTQPAVPLVVSTKEGDKPRASVEEVYEQINKDLDLAINLFANGTVNTNNTHISLAVAKGFKARVALTMGDWETAATYAKDARTGKSLMSGTEYVDGFTSASNKEWLWCSTQLADQLPTYGAFASYISGNFNSSFSRVDPKGIGSKLYYQISNSDIRKQLWWDGSANTKQYFGVRTATGALVSGSSYRKYMNRKFMVPDVASRAIDIPYMRTAELFLIEAEALARLGRDTEAAQTLFDLVKTRDAQYVLSTKRGDDLLNEILIQRRIELWGEGFRFFDLKRTDTPLDRTGLDNPTNGTSFAIIANVLTMPKASESNMWEFKIPQDEINANTALTPADQNP